ncbi:MAG: RsmF rRNA methyltransferase first C-terminal domain-containing protein [Butyrivibrio sp.]|nr:RsmF rRNA methyltransferase first C-terminal domain-containing protein [Butyrivibrio sp.]
MLPELFVERMKNLLPEDEFKAFMDSFGDTDTRYHALRINTLKIADRHPDIDGLGEQVPWEETGYYYDDSVSPGKHPYHEAGLYYIQEPSAMAPVRFLDPKPGERVLDLCAAPGGKSTQIAVKMQGKGILISNEISRERAKILSLNVERLGITNCMVLNETPEHIAERFEGYFDKILVDAPCSGEGMFRKNEIATSEWSPENVSNCAQRQKEILDFASKCLAPGGTLVYSTCTFAPAENEESIYRFIASHRDFHVQKTSLIGGMDNARVEFISRECVEQVKEEFENSFGDLSGTDFEQFDAGLKEEVRNAVRLWPHKLRGEGHFMCVLRRDGDPAGAGVNEGADCGPSAASGKRDGYVPGGRNLPAKKDVMKVFMDFAKETLAFEDDSAHITKSGIDLGQTSFLFGDQLYLAPEDMPSTGGLKVMRPGLHLGTIKKDRFEPSHALALSMKPLDAKSTVDFSADSAEIRQYLNGQTLRVAAAETDKKSKGWTLITVDGFSIGWAKLAGGMLKNHYPKGLRINY